MGRGPVESSMEYGRACSHAVLLLNPLSFTSLDCPHTAPLALTQLLGILI